MLDLPEGFPKYTKDLKYLFDLKVREIGWRRMAKINISQPNRRKYTLEQKEQFTKLHNNYPEKNNSHIAIYDARWNKKLHEFIEKYL